MGWAARRREYETARKKTSLRVHCSRRLEDVLETWWTWPLNFVQKIRTMEIIHGYLGVPYCSCMEEDQCQIEGHTAQGRHVVTDLVIKALYKIAIF